MPPDAVEQPGASKGRPARLGEVLRAFLKLGLTSFGGPIAHLGYFHREFVEKRRWLDDAAYADTVALCNFLPGPASSQTVFALGMRRAGLAGAIIASLCFTLPSAALMIAFGYGVAHWHIENAGWLHGLKLAAVAVVAQAVWSMGVKLCPDRERLTMCIVSAAVLLALPIAWVQVAVIAAGAGVGWLMWRRIPLEPAAASQGPATGRRGPALAALILFAALLLALPFVSASTGSKTAAEFDSFYRSGSLVFGGGHVVLPLLRAEVVPRGWVTDDQFLSGYGAAQALPGPLFTFSSYLGTVMTPGRWAWAGGLWCLFAIFLPAWLLIGGALPFWERLRSKAWAQGALRGANAAVVGVLLAALYNPVFTTSVKGLPDFAAALVAFGLLVAWKTPPWVVVMLAAAAGQWILR